MSFHASRVPALDGVRGIAILLVFAVHTTPVLLAGGRIGVDLFFVLSGFLITSILLQEFRARGSIHLGNFYMRRVLRLYPAMISVALFVVIYVWLFAPEQMSLTLWNAFGAIFYFFNWQLVAAFPDYLQHQWMLSHVWSLSVEEQFYIVWPLTILGLLKFGSRKLMFGVALAGIVIPATARAILWQHEHTLQIYFRTDLRFDGLMWGAFTAMLIDAKIYPTEALRPHVSRAAIIGLIGLLTIASFDGMGNGFLYVAGFALVGLCSALLIYGSVICPHPLLLPLLEFKPLRWIGKISYGLYLWHWPIIRAVSDLKLPPLQSTLLEFALTFAVATISFYFMERRFLDLKKYFAA